MHTGQLPPLRSPSHLRATVGRDRKRGRREGDERGVMRVGVKKSKEVCFICVFNLSLPFSWKSCRTDAQHFTFNANLLNWRPDNTVWKSYLKANRIKGLR